MIRAENIGFSYGNKKVLQDISFDVKKGEIFGIIGPNGSGKTTMIKVISKILKGYTGKVFIDNVDSALLNYRETAAKISGVPQENKIFMPYTVGEIVLSGRYHSKDFFGSYTVSDYNVADNVMRELKIDGIKNKNADKISGGEKQLVFIARALASGSEAVTFDEPTSNLDIGHNAEMFNVIKRINGELKKTIVIVSHDINFIMTLCDRVMVIENGLNIFTGTPAEIIENKVLEKIYKIKLIYAFEDKKIKYIVPDIGHSPIETY